MAEQCPELHDMLGLHMYPHSTINDEEAMMKWFFETTLRAALLRKRWHKLAQEPLVCEGEDEVKFLVAERCSISLRGFDDDGSVQIAEKMFPATVKAGQALAVMCRIKLPGMESWRDMFRCQLSV